MSDSEGERAQGGKSTDPQGAPVRPLLGVVLAGGRSSRMGREKAFVPLRGRPLLAHVLSRLGPQVDWLIINANGDPARFAPFGRPLIPDDPPGLGPLGGIAAGLRYALAGGWPAILTCPADAPDLPADLAARLGTVLGSAGAACAGGPAGLEPLFALWRTDALPAVEAALLEGRLAVREALARVDFATAPFAEAACFANINTPEDMAALEARPGDALKP